jgi:hypothetical protein
MEINSLLWMSKRSRKLQAALCGYQGITLMSRDRHRAQEDWDEEQDDDSDEDDEEYEPHPRQHRRRRQDEEEDGQPQRRRGSWPCLLKGCVGGILIIVLLAIVFVIVVNGSIPVPVPGGSIGRVSNSSTYMQQSQQTLQLATIAQIQVRFVRVARRQEQPIGAQVVPKRR